MALQLGSLREALVEAGASPEKAAKAAEEAAMHERRFDELKTEIVSLRSDTKIESASIRSDVRVLQWMVGTLLAAVAPILVAAMKALLFH